jgi:nicotinate-nucleotide adenylyltransferase
MRIGLLGGTFDPVHLGHLAAAEAALRCADLDRVLMVPAARPPHRSPAQASAEDRLAMCRLAVEGRPGLDVWDVELRRSGPSYTIDTLLAFGPEQGPEAEPSLVLGWDAARQIGSWHQSKQVLDRARMVIIGRPGLQAPGADDLRRTGYDPGRVRLCLEETPDIAGTEIRRLAAAGGSLAGLVPGPVEGYIRAHGLYRSQGA